MNIKIEHVFAKVPRYALKLATNVSNAVAEAGADLIGDKAAMLIGAATGALVCMLIIAANARRPAEASYMARSHKNGAQKTLYTSL